MSGGERAAIAEEYREAAIERIVCAQELYSSGRLVEANYFAGVAVECILRAYRIRIDAEFDARHNIGDLYRMGRFADIVPPANAVEINAALGDVIALWSNGDRYLPEYALKRDWKKRKLYRHRGLWIKGDFFKELTRKLMNSSETIVNMGIIQWKPLFKN